jgi:hypothetical protein
MVQPMNILELQSLYIKKWLMQVNSTDLQKEVFTLNTPTGNQKGFFKNHKKKPL